MLFEDVNDKRVLVMTFFSGSLFLFFSSLIR